MLAASTPPPPIVPHGCFTYTLSLAHLSPSRHLPTSMLAFLGPDPWLTTSQDLLSLPCLEPLPCTESQALFPEVYQAHICAQKFSISQ